MTFTFAMWAYKYPSLWRSQRTFD